MPDERPASSRSLDLLCRAAALVREAQELAPSYNEAKTYRSRLQDVRQTLTVAAEDTLHVF